MLNYLDFEVTFQSRSDGNIYVCTTGPTGTADWRRFDLAFSQRGSLNSQVESLRSQAENQICRKSRFGKQKTQVNVDPLGIGSILFDSIFDPLTVTQLDQCIARVQQERKGLRIKLRIDPSNPDLAGLSGLPWELLYREDQRKFFGLSNQFPVVRSLEVARPTPAIPLRLPFRVMVVISNPKGTGNLDLSKERESIRRSWGSRSDVQVDFLETPTRSEIQRALGQAEYHVFHYMGHGDFEPETGNGTLLLEDENGDSDPITGESLGMLLADEPTLRLAFLNACNTAQSTDNIGLDPFSGVAMALIQRGVPIVLAMQFPFSDAAAIAFANKFYELLPQFHPVDWIVSEARKEVKMLQERDSGFEWATPALYTRCETGMIFEPLFGTGQVATNQREISRLNEKVRERWIRQKLDVDIPIKPPIELNKSLAPKALQRSGVSTEEQVPAGKTTATLFDESERSLLILGEPGFGKSTTLFALAQYLLRLFDRDPSQPVPVVFYLSSWARSQHSIREWVTREVLEFYRISDRDFSEWLKTGKVVLLLDGLDMLSLKLRDKCIRAINEYADEQISLSGFCGVAVCCRFDEYERSNERLNLERAIQLRPLSKEQILSFLGKFEGQMDGLRDFIEHDPDLLEDAKTPLVLGMLSVAFHLAPDKFAQLANRDLGTSKDGAGESVQDERKQILMRTYLDRVFEDQEASEAKYSRDQILDGLTWLSRKMSLQHQAVFQFENLQPSWLSSFAQRWLYALIYGTALGLVIGSALEIIWLASFVADPPTSFVRSADNYIYPLAAVWGVVWTAIAVFFPDLITRFRLDVAPEKRTWKFAALMCLRTCFLIYVTWMAIWILAFLVQYQFDLSKTMWLSHSITGGLMIAALYGIKTFNQNRSFTGTTEKIVWNSQYAWRGVAIGLSVGLVVWSVFYLVYMKSESFGALARNLALYPPLGVVVGGLFAGLKKEESETKTVPNEGVLLSLRNSLIAMVSVGVVLGLSMVPMLMVGFRDPESTLIVDFASKLGICAVLGVGTAIASFLWFGGIDVLRHYSIRLTLWVTGQLPWDSVGFLDQMTRLSLLQKIGGGYMFRNNLIRDYFKARSETAQQD